MNVIVYSGSSSQSRVLNYSNFSGTELFYTSLFKSPNLLAYFQFEGNSLPTIGTFNGADTDMTYSIAEGKFIKGAAYNGTTSKIIISSASTSPFRQTTAITYSFWAKIPSAGLTRMGTASTGGQGSGGVIAAQTGAIQFTWTPTTPNSDRTWSTTRPVTADTWNHYVFTMSFTGVSSGIWYVNGNAVTTTISIADVTDGTPRTSPYNTNAGDGIGARYINSFFYGNASLDDVAIFNRVLTPAEVNILYSVGSPRVLTF